MRDSFFTTAGADELGRSTGKNPALVIIILENTRDYQEIITSVGAQFW